MTWRPTTLRSSVKPSRPLRIRRWRRGPTRDRCSRSMATSVSGQLHRQLLAPPDSTRPVERRPVRAMDSGRQREPAPAATACFRRVAARASRRLPRARTNGAMEARRLRFANMRLRLQPTLSLSDNIRVHMMLDVFDNLVLGSTPEVKSVNQFGQIPGRAPGVPVDSLTQTSPPPGVVPQHRGRQHLLPAGLGRGDQQHHRSASLWPHGAPVGPRDALERGRGDQPARRPHSIRISSPRSTASSSSASSRASFSGSPGTLRTRATSTTPSWTSRTFRSTRAGWTTRGSGASWSRAAWSRSRSEKRLARGKWVINGGAYFIYRTQFLSTSTAPLLGTISDIENAFVRRDAKVYMPDGWLQVLWKDLRLEVEFAGIFGQIQNISPAEFPPDRRGVQVQAAPMGCGLRR